ncbi:MAG: PilT/PilU family type 4a pilus ATPase [Acidobacteriota bacterium]|nr:MAG: PilT/PilU family type 4a pilus ATPase [Acidobacteriota bacterium]
MAYFDLNPLLVTMLDSATGVSDLNLSVGKPPQVEIEGKLQAVSYAGVEKLSPYQTELIAMRLLRGKRDLIEKLLRTGSVDLSYSLAHKTRFRVNIFAQRGSYSVVFRVIPNKIPTVEELGIPTQLNEITEERNGIVLVTGPTGSGKSTTLAALLNKMNREKAIHIITIEDPIEYLYPAMQATINQREVGADTETFSLALRAALRQAPKVILVGEMRDTETINTALEASETGHLVLSTLHTIDASKTIDRIVGVFPKNEERQIRTRFAQSFKWIVSQRLIPRRNGGRMAVCEILRGTSRTRDYIREGEKEGKSLLDAMEDGALEGMQSFDSELQKLIESGVLDEETGLSYASNAANLKLKLSMEGVRPGNGAPPSSEEAPMPDTGMDNLIER